MSDHLREALNDIHDAIVMVLDILEFDGYENEDVHSLLSRALRTAREASEAA